MKNHLLVLLGAIVGGIAGHFACIWIAQQGFYAMVVPGAFVGFGAGIARSRSPLLPIICALLALAAGFLTEWRARPFLADPGFRYFFTHLQNLQPITFLLIALGTLVGFWIPFQRSRERPAPASPPSP